jgi:hypothetical protein
MTHAQVTHIRSGGDDMEIVTPIDVAKPFFFKGTDAPNHEVRLHFDGPSDLPPAICTVDSSGHWQSGEINPSIDGEYRVVVKCDTEQAEPAHGAYIVNVKSAPAPVAEQGVNAAG